MKLFPAKALLCTGLAVLTASLCPRDAVVAQASGHSQGPGESAFLLTVFLRHDESKTLEQINHHRHDTGYHEQFTPQGVEVVSWYVVMGIGQVVTLRVLAEKLREVNRALEESAWGGYRTELYPTYDYPVAGHGQMFFSVCDP